MFLAVSIAFAVLVVNAYHPVKREPFTVVSFALGWIPGELPLQVCAVEVAGAAVFAWDGALGSWPGWVGLAVAAGSWAGLVQLAVIAHGAGELVDEALEGAKGGAITADGFDPAPSWNRWWRLVIAVPFRWWGIKRVRNVDYWGDGNYRHKLDLLTRRSPAAGGGTGPRLHPRRAPGSWGTSASRASRCSTSWPGGVGSAWPSTTG